MEGEDKDDSFGTELIYSDIVNLARLYGINWNMSDLGRLQEALAKSIKEESGTIRKFFK